MKNIYKSGFILMVILLVSSCSKKGCTDPMSLAYNIDASKDDGSCTYPENSKKTLVFNSTGTWCQYCGDWGKTFSDDLTNDFPSDVQIITLHANDDFSVDIGYSMQSHLDNIHGPTGVPHFYLGTADVPNNYNQLVSAVTADLLLSPDVNIDFNFNVVDGKMNINVQSELSNGFTSDNLYLATYILEDGQVKDQNVLGNYDPNYIHDNILRTEASGSGSAFGSLIEFDANGRNLTSYSDVALAPSSLWNHDNLYVVAVIWEFDGSDYRLVNVEK